MILLNNLNINFTDIIVYDEFRVYSKGENCLFGNKLYKSNSNNNKNDSPILGLKWDQVL